MKRIIACALALLMPLAAAEAAVAKPKGKLKARTFRMQIDGEQLTTWTYEKDAQPSCDWPETAAGRQYITFGTYDYGATKNPKVKVSPRKGGGVAFKFARNDITLTADGQQVRNYRILYSQMTDCPPGEGPFGGEDPPPDPIGTAKCREIGELELYLGNTIDDVENPSYPTGLGGKEEPPSPLYFGGDASWGSAPGFESLPADCADSGQYNADIGIVESQGEWAGAAIPAAGKLDVKRLLGKGKRTTVELHRVVQYPNAIQTYAGPPHTTGKTVMDATITFTPAR